MAFLAVLREGFETAVFLLAVFQDAHRPGRCRRRRRARSGRRAGHRLRASTGAACGSTSDASSASPASCSCWSPPACSPARVHTAHEAGWFELAPGPGVRPHLARRARHGPRLAADRDARPAAEARPSARSSSTARTPSRCCSSCCGRPRPRPQRSRPRAAVARAAAASPACVAGRALLIAACGGSASTAETRRRKDVEVALTDAGCEPAEIELAAGPTTFKVTDGGSGVTEFEVLDGTASSARSRTSTPGLERLVHAHAQGGRLHRCPAPDGSPDRRHADRHGRRRDRRRRAARRSRRRSRPTAGYVERADGDLLVDDTRRSPPPSRPATSTQAKALYAPARVPYERIEPVAESFGDLDPAIDAREGDVPKPRVDRLPPHREGAVGRRTRPTGMARVADKLLTDVKELEQRRQTVETRAGADRQRRRRAARRGLQSKITGEEERYSHTDLVDFQANVEGAQAAFEVVAPILRDKRRRSWPTTIASAVRRRRRLARRRTATRRRLRALRRRSRRPTRARSARRSTRWPSRCRRWPRKVVGLRRRGRRDRGLARRPWGAARLRAVAVGSAARVCAPAATGGGRPPAIVPFHGEHQAGIVTPAQDRLHFAAFDLTHRRPRGRLRDCCKTWTRAAARMTRRRASAGSATTTRSAPPDDTGEALGLTPARLTVTFGFGPSLFDDRFGLGAPPPGGADGAAARCPATRSTPSARGGDLCVQACADDPQVAFHAVRNLARIGRGTAVMRWSQLGFGRTLDHEPRAGHAAQPDGLQGRHQQHPAPRTPRRWREHVWVAAPTSPWLDGRHLPRRAPHPHADRGLGPRVAGRPGARRSGAPRQRRAARRRRTSSTSVDLDATDADGEPLIAVDAHIRLAAPTRTAAHACCAAATRSPTAWTRASASSTPACSSSPSSATRAAVRPASSGGSGRRRAQRVHQARQLAVFAVPPGVRNAAGTSVSHSSAEWALSVCA